MMRGFPSLRKGGEARPASSSRRHRATRTGLIALLGILALSRPCLGQNQDGGPFDYIRLADEIRAAQQTNPAAEPGVAASDIALLQDALLLHRLSAQFYNINADATFLTGVTPVNGQPTAPVTAPGTIAGTGAGFFDGTTPVTTPVGTDGSTTTPGNSTGTGATTSSALTALRSIVQEIRTHHNTHVALLEQALGANAPQPPAFQNLRAAGLSQFLDMAIMMEDLGTSAHQGMMPLIQSQQVMMLMEGIALVEGRHAGALRAYRKIASPAEGGDPNITLTEDGGAVNQPRTREQVMAAIQPFIGSGAVLPGTDTGTGTGNTGTGGTSPTNP